MTLPPPRHVPLLALTLLVGAGCSVFPAPSAPPRYYVPPIPVATEHADGQRGPRLRLRNVTAADHIGQRLVWNSGGTEVGYYEQHRWADDPEAYLWRALMTELFAERGLHRADSGPVPVLDVWLLRFEELIGPTRQARVEVGVSLVDRERLSLLTRSFEVRVDVRGDDMADVADAMGRALTQAVDQAAVAIVAAVP